MNAPYRKPVGSRLHVLSLVLTVPVVGVLGAQAVLAQSATASEAPSEREALVVPSAAERDLAEARVWVPALHRALTGAGVRAVSEEDASASFEAQVSSPAVELSASDIERWVARSQSAVRHLARADYDRARADLLEAHALASGAAEELNREAERARQVLDTCLYMVRAYVETRDEASAMNQARACRQLVPGAEPSPYRHTPEVRAIIERVDRAIEAEAPGQLVVTSEPAGCAVRLNGISFGRTPFRMDGIAAGDYRLQVECDEVARGRIRRIRVGAGETVVHVDGAFDHAIRSRPGLGLMYDSAELARTRVGHHAQDLREAMNVREVWLVWLETPSRLRVDRIGAEGASSAWLALDAANPASADAALSEAVRHLRGGRSVDLERPEASVRTAVELPEGQSGTDDEDGAEEGQTPRREALLTPERRRERRQRRALGVTSGVSAAALVAATGVHIARVRRGQAFAQLFAITRQADWLNLRWPTILTAAGGGLLATATLPVLLPHREGIPVGAWVTGAVGVGFAAASVGTTLRRPDCAGFGVDRQPCIERAQLGDRAVIFASAALPLLTVPLIYALRPARLAPAMSVSRDGVWLSISGTL